MRYQNERIGNAVKILSGYAFDSTLFNKEKNGLPLIRVRDVNSGFTGLYYSGEYNPAYLINKGDVLVSLDGDFKCIVWKGEKALLNQRVCKLIPNENKLHKGFLFYVLPQKLQQIHKNTDYTTVKHLSVKSIENIAIPFPSISDQIKIVEILNKADIVKEQRRKNISVLGELTKSVFWNMFGALNGKQTRLTEVIEVNPPKSEIQNIPKQTEVSFIPMASVSETGQIDLSQSKVLSEVWTGFTYFREGDVVFAKITPSMENGKGAIVRNLRNKIGFGTTEFHVLRPLSGKTNAEWLYNLTMQAPFRKTAEKNMVGSGGQRRVPSSFIKDYKTIIPSIELQNEFAEIFKKTEILRSEFEADLIDVVNLYEALTQKAFNGDLDLDGMDVFVEEYYSSTDNDRTEPSHFEKPINWKSVEVRLKQHQEKKIEVQNLDFTEKDFDRILDSFLIEKKNGFQFNEFTDLLCDKEIAFEYEDIRDFIFQKLEQKKLVQYYSSDYWMNNNYKPETSPLQDDFSGTDGNIWFTVNPIDK